MHSGKHPSPRPKQLDQLKFDSFHTGFFFFHEWHNVIKSLKPVSCLKVFTRSVCFPPFAILRLNLHIKSQFI